MPQRPRRGTMALQDTTPRPARRRRGASAAAADTIMHTPSTTVHRPDVGGPAQPVHGFSAICGARSPTVRRAVLEAPDAVVCSPPSGPPGPLFLRSSATSRTGGGRPSPLPDDPLSHAWPRIRAELRRAVAESTWHLWLEPLRAGSLTEGELLLEAPDEIRPWIASNFSRLLQAAADAVLGTGAATVRLVAPGTGAPREPSRAGPGTGLGAPGAAGRSFNPPPPLHQFLLGGPQPPPPPPPPSGA